MPRTEVTAACKVGEGVRVRDLKSTNGTFVGDSRIEAAMNRGINTVVVDERTRANGMRYTMRHVIR